MKIHNKKILALGLGTILSLSLVGCNEEDVTNNNSVGKEVETTTPTKSETEFDEKTVKEIEDMIRENGVKMEEKNMDSYLEDFIIPNEESEENLRLLTQDLFDETESDVEITEIEIIKLTDTTAQTLVSQNMKVKENPDYASLKIVTRYEMKLEGDDWKFTHFEYQSIVPIDENGKPLPSIYDYPTDENGDPIDITK